VLDLKIKKLTNIMEKSNNHYESDMVMIRIRALKWTQGQIHDIILNNVTKDWPVYDTMTNMLAGREHIQLFAYCIFLLIQS
jgi:hypothetical protein